ncbi:MAG: hypothetical protein IKW00_01155 [Clostridia bacterium]|nr:hypothetical protein [Clostridia bacterium]
MQTPESGYDNQYEQRGFTAVPQSGPQPQPYGQAPYYAQPGTQIPTQNAMGQPVMQQMPYPPQQPPYGQQPYPPQQPQQPQSEYYQDAYQPQQPDPFSQDARVPYRAPKQTNYNKLNLFLGIFIALLAVMLIGVAFLKFAGNPQVHTALVGDGTLGSSYTGEALIVRNETLYTEKGITQIDYSAVKEGTSVTRGTNVCTVYTSGFSTKEWTKLRDFRSQIKEYQLLLLSTTNIEADPQLKRYNSSVLERAQETQALVQGASGNLLNQESLLSQSISDRSYYLKQKYADDQKLSRLYDDEKMQLQRIETWTKQFGAGDVGIVSFYTDGFERVLTSSTCGQFTPDQVADMYKGKLPDTASLERNEIAVYRLVRQGTWKVLMLCDDTSWTPEIGASYELLIESFDNTRVSAQVEAVTRAGGRLLIRLAVQSDVTPVLYVRSCHVQLSESVYTLTVPSASLTSSNGQIGIVVVQPDGQYFLPVTVVNEVNNTAYIIPSLDNILFVGSTVLVF